MHGLTEGRSVRPAVTPGEGNSPTIKPYREYVPLGLNYHSGRKKLGPLKSGTDRKFSDLPNGLSSFSFARKTTGRNRARSHSGEWRGLQTKWDLKYCRFRIRHISSDTCLSKSEQQLPSSSSRLSSSDSSGAWISRQFRIQVRSADECVAPGRRQPQKTRWTFDGRLSSPGTNLKVGLLPLFFLQHLLSHYVSVIYGANFPFKASLSRCVGVGAMGMRESLILRRSTHLARESISGIRKVQDTLDKVPDWQAANFDSENVSSNRGIFEKKKNRVEREEENKLPNHSLTQCNSSSRAEYPGLALSTTS